jgi:hypothetical protein
LWSRLIMPLNCSSSSLVRNPWLSPAISGIILPVSRFGTLQINHAVSVQYNMNFRNIIFGIFCHLIFLTTCIS